MNKNTIIQTKSRSSKHQTEKQSHLVTESQIDRLASELDILARQRLPDRVLKDDLTGLESEIRQDAILLALQWFLKQHNDPQRLEIYPWNSSRVMAATLKISKRDHLKVTRRVADSRLSFPDLLGTVSIHPVSQKPSDWSATTILTLTRQAIRMAHGAGKITASNAAVVLELLDGEFSVADLAKRLGVHRSSIYQHLGRVKNEIPHIIEGIEVPLIEGL